MFANSLFLSYLLLNLKYETYVTSIDIETLWLLGLLKRVRKTSFEKCHFETFEIFRLTTLIIMMCYIIKQIFGKFMPFISIAIRNSNLYTHSRKEAQTNKVLLELATIVFDESSSTVDNLVSRILFNSIFLLECERCQVVLLNTNLIVNNNYTSIISRRSSVNVILYKLTIKTEQFTNNYL